MIVYKCDFCGEVRDCKPREIEQTEYDVCSSCWSELTAKLKGKGHPKKTHEAAPESPVVIVPDIPREQHPVLPGQPPEIIASVRANGSQRFPAAGS